jgi:hypothetical protein
LAEKIVPATPCVMQVAAWSAWEKHKPHLLDVSITFIIRYRDKITVCSVGIISQMAVSACGERQIPLPHKDYSAFAIAATIICCIYLTYPNYYILWFSVQNGGQRGPVALEAGNDGSFQGPPKS